ncbi:RadC family protein [Brevundimonas lutea]|uniref:RadC family protein n=1 Tax=Brevundimonas lutea TaxID=2293980 RepID=UPI000F031424|nr:DNA repair protein RadC [Brevundimonas lutea]
MPQSPRTAGPRDAEPPEPPEPGIARPGCEQLDDRALLARLLRHVPTDSVAIASTLLARFGSLGAVAWADPAERARAAGTEPEALLDLEVQRDVAVRLARIEASRRPVISSWAALEAYARAAMAHRPREQFRVLFLDHRNRLMADEMVADGTVDHAPVYPREVIRRALEVSASALILVHNHPSGDPTPSRADIEMTCKVVEAAKALGLQVHDHLVVGREGTASFRGLGLI